MTKAQMMARFTKVSALVLDAVRNEWVKPFRAYEVKTMMSKDMAMFTPIKLC